MTKTETCGECNGRRTIDITTEVEAADGGWDEIVTGTETCDFCDGAGTITEVLHPEVVALNARLRREGIPGFVYVEGKGWRAA